MLFSTSRPSQSAPPHILFHFEPPLVGHFPHLELFEISHYLALHINNCQSVFPVIVSQNAIDPRTVVHSHSCILYSRLSLSIPSFSQPPHLFSPHSHYNSSITCELIVRQLPSTTSAKVETEDNYTSKQIQFFTETVSCQNISDCSKYFTTITSSGIF